MFYQIKLNLFEDVNNQQLIRSFFIYYLQVTEINKLNIKKRRKKFFIETLNFD